MKIIKAQKKVAAEECILRTGERWKSNFISRDLVPEFTGGALSARTFANLDSAGLGPLGAFKIGRKQCYPIDSLVSWLISRLEV